jgi:hypothetical protein
LIAHNAIIAHATAVNLYRTKYEPSQKGTIGTLRIVSYRFNTTGAHLLSFAQALC